VTRPPHTVLLYAALLALLFVGLSLRTLRMRRKMRIAIGDGGQPAMLRAMRVHANFAEYVPLTLLLIYLAEASGAGAGFVHGMGLAALLGRGAHAYGVGQLNEDYRFRTVGMALTFATLIAASLYLLRVYVAAALP
jgi:uncharacterized membrane protein YecN with MAPEG domain